jgi:hypothetical protein
VSPRVRGEGKGNVALLLGTRLLWRMDSWKVRGDLPTSFFRGRKRQPFGAQMRRLGNSHYILARKPSLQLGICPGFEITKSEGKAVF